MPAALPIDWEEARRAAETGAPLKFVAQKFGVDFEAVKKRCQREKWLIPARVEALREQQRAAMLERSKVQGLSPSVPKTPSSDSLSTTQGQGTTPAAGPVTAESLAIMGQDLQATVLSKTLQALKRADLASLPINSWQDAKTATEVGLKVAGLESSQGPAVSLVFTGTGDLPPLVEIEAAAKPITSESEQFATDLL